MNLQNYFEMITWSQFIYDLSSITDTSHLDFHGLKED